VGGLVAGRWSLVDHFERSGRRYLVARRNDPSVRDPRALNLRERQVVWYASLGHSNKLIGYQLGLSFSTVATHLANATRKRGVASRVELIALVRSVLGAGA
jgi:DNA-binding CsgD family transcriptional regulator